MVCQTRLALDRFSNALKINALSFIHSFIHSFILAVAIIEITNIAYISVTIYSISVIKVSVPIFSGMQDILNTFILVFGGAVATGDRGRGAVPSAHQLFILSLPSIKLLCALTTPKHPGHISHSLLILNQPITVSFSNCSVVTDLT